MSVATRAKATLRARRSEDLHAETTQWEALGAEHAETLLADAFAGPVTVMEGLGRRRAHSRSVAEPGTVSICITTANLNS